MPLPLRTRSKTAQRHKEVSDSDAKRKDAERDLKKKEAEVAGRERKVKERELEADDGFERQNTTALAKLEKQFGKSLMPSSGATLTAAELDDLVAYLAGLRGDR